MSDHGIEFDGGASRLAWFLAGAFAVIVVVGLYFVADSYFASAGSTVAADMPKTIIEAQ